MYQYILNKIEDTGMETLRANAIKIRETIKETEMLKQILK